MFKPSFVISGCKASTINVDKIWFSVIKHYCKKKIYNILRKYSYILVNLYLYHISII